MLNILHGVAVTLIALCVALMAAKIVARRKVKKILEEGVCE